MCAIDDVTSYLEVCAYFLIEISSLYLVEYSDIHLEMNGDTHHLQFSIWGERGCLMISRFQVISRFNLRTKRE